MMKALLPVIEPALAKIVTGPLALIAVTRPDRETTARVLSLVDQVTLELVRRRPRVSMPTAISWSVSSFVSVSRLVSDET